MKACKTSGLPAFLMKTQNSWFFHWSFKFFGNAICIVTRICGKNQKFGSEGLFGTFSFFLIRLRIVLFKIVQFGVSRFPVPTV